MIIIPSKSIYSVEQSIILDNKINNLELNLKDISEEVTYHSLSTKRLPEELPNIADDKKFDFSNFHTLDDSGEISTDSAFADTYDLFEAENIDTKIVNRGSADWVEMSWCQLQPITTHINFLVKKSDTGIDETYLTDQQIKEEVLKLIKIEQSIVANKKTYMLSYKAKTEVSNGVLTIQRSDYDNTIHYLDMTSETVYNIPLGATAPSYNYGVSSEQGNFYAKGKANVYELEIDVDLRQKDYYIVSFDVVYGMGILTYTNAFSLSVANNGLVKNFLPKLEEYRAETIRIDLMGEFHELKIEDTPINIENNNDGISYSLETNNFIQKQYSDRFLNQLSKTFDQYKNGKETLSVLCSIGEYYDTKGNKVISTQTPQKMIFEQYDEVVPMYKNENGYDAPFSLTPEHQLKTFTVLGSEIYFDGAVWQKLQLQEFGSTNITNGTEGLEYEYDKSTKTFIAKGIGTATDKDIVIASMVNGKTVDKISYNAFRLVDNIESIVIPETIESFEEKPGYSFDTFGNCDNLSKVYFNASEVSDLTSGGGILGLSGINNGLQLHFGNNVKRIPKNLCNHLSVNSYITEIHISKNVETIGNNAFYNNTKIEKIYFNAEQMDDLPILQNDIFNNCGTSSANGITVYIGKDVKKTPSNLYYSTTAPNISTVIFDENSICSSISSYSFDSLSTLKTAIIRGNVTTIKSSAFGWDINLESVVFPKGLETIESSAFIDCDNISKIFFEGSADEWNIDIDVNNQGSLLTATRYYYSENQPIVDGYYWHYDQNGFPIIWEIKTSEGIQYSLNSDEKSYSVSNLGSCTDRNIIIPKSYNGLPVTTIKMYAFYNKQDIESIAISSTVISIERYSFYKCSLIKIIIPNSVISIGENSFFSCTNLTNITIPDSVTSVGASAFSGCTSLNSVTIGNSLTSIANNMFNNCSNLTSITIPDSVTSIGEYAFSKCDNITDVY